jgi:hypothetical protein
LILEPSSDTGTKLDGITYASPFVLTGVGLPNTLVTLNPGGLTQTSDINGAFSFTVTKPVGQYAFVASKPMDDGGNIQESLPLNLRITVPPDVPTLVLDPLTDTGTKGVKKRPSNNPRSVLFREYKYRRN